MTNLYTSVIGQRGSKRHLIHAMGSGGVFPRALCQEAIRLRDDESAEPCKDCRRIALTEIALALNSTFGLDQLGVQVASEVRFLSYGEEPLPETA